MTTGTAVDGETCLARNCHACCSCASVPPFTPAELDCVPVPLLSSLIASGRPPNTPCLWSHETTGLCRHYEHRPRLCIEFEVDGPACYEFRRGEH